MPEVAESFDDSGWPTAVEKSDDTKPAYAGSWVYRATVNIPSIQRISTAVYISHASKEAQLYINGQRVADGSNTNAYLKDGKNTIAVVNMVEKDKQLGGVVRLETAALPWQRSLFNGLAQVIVQSDKNAGPITLTASGDNLHEGALTINSKP